MHTILRALAYAGLGAVGNLLRAPMLALAVLLWVDPDDDALAADAALGALFVGGDCGDNTPLLCLGALWLAVGVASLFVAVDGRYLLPVVLALRAVIMLAEDGHGVVVWTVWPLAPTLVYLALAFVDAGLSRSPVTKQTRLRYGGVLCCAACPLALVVAALVLAGALSARYLQPSSSSSAAPPPADAPAATDALLDVQEALRLAQAQHYNMMSSAEKNV